MDTRGGFAAIMLLCFAEETSWGQHLFGFETPRFLHDLNAQNETNLHNLWIFHQCGRRRGLAQGLSA